MIGGSDCVEQRSSPFPSLLPFFPSYFKKLAITTSLLCVINPPDGDRREVVRFAKLAIWRALPGSILYLAGKTFRVRKILNG